MPAGQFPFGAESTADRLIREAMERGEFEDLPGEGKPIPGQGSVDDELWWVRKWYQRNRTSEKSTEVGDD